MYHVPDEIKRSPQIDSKDHVNFEVPMLSTLSEVQCHCIFRILSMKRLKWPGQTHTSMSTPELHKCLLCLSFANLQRIPQNLSAWLWPHWLLVIDCLVEEFKTYCLCSLCKGTHLLQPIRRKCNAQTHAFSTTNQDRSSCSIRKTDQHNYPFLPYPINMVEMHFVNALRII